MKAEVGYRINEVRAGVEEHAGAPASKLSEVRFGDDSSKFGICSAAQHATAQLKIETCDGV